MTDTWAAKVLAGVPRHNAQDAKSMTGYAAAVWLHEDAVVDAIARMGAEDGLVERDEAYKAVDENWITHRRVVAAEAEVAALRERVARLEGALNAIDAMDPEQQINGFSESALRGTVLHMGGIARAALTDGGSDE